MIYYLQILLGILSYLIFGLVFSYLTVRYDHLHNNEKGLDHTFVTFSTFLWPVSISLWLFCLFERIPTSVYTYATRPVPTPKERYNKKIEKLVK